MSMSSSLSGNHAIFIELTNTHYVALLRILNRAKTPDNNFVDVGRNWQVQVGKPRRSFCGTRRCIGFRASSCHGCSHAYARIEHSIAYTQIAHTASFYKAVSCS